MSEPSVDDILSRVTAGAASMEGLLAELAAAYRTEVQTLRERNTSLHAALLANTSEANASADSSGSTKGSIALETFADHLAADVFKVSAFGREFFMHQSILKVIPFFAAKLDRWTDEELIIPDQVTYTAFVMLLKRLYVGTSLPIGDVNLSVQVLRLAKYWCLESVVQDLIPELKQKARRDDVTLLEELATDINVPELAAVVIELQAKTSRECSFAELETMIRHNLQGGDMAMQKICAAALRASPQAKAALRAQFSECDFFCRSLGLTVLLVPGFSWFWTQVIYSELCANHTDLVFVWQRLSTKLNSASGPVSWPDYVDTGASMTYIECLTKKAIGNDGNDGNDFQEVVLAFSDMLSAAALQLHIGNLEPRTLEGMFSSIPKMIMIRSEFDDMAAKMIKSLPLAKSIEIFHILSMRLPDVGPKTKDALQLVMGKSTDSIRVKPLLASQPWLTFLISLPLVFLGLRCVRSGTSRTEL